MTSPLKKKLHMNSDRQTTHGCPTSGCSDVGSNPVDLATRTAQQNRGEAPGFGPGNKGRSGRALALGSFSSAVLALALTGCLPGPKYHAPAAPASTAPAYKESTVHFQDADGWKVANPQDAMLKGKWWEVYNEPELNQLEDQLEINNQNIKVYFENFMEARALVREARAQYWPTITTSPSWNRAKTSGNLSHSSTANTGSTSTTWAFPFDVSWTPDFFGKIRSEVREAQYGAQVSAADLQNERLVEQASLAEYFFELRGQDALQKILDDTVTADKKALELTQTLYDTGVDQYISVVEAKSTLESAESAAINLGVARAEYEHAIAMLIGKPATDFSLLARPALVAPPPIPIGVPSELLQRRPDVARPSALWPRPTPPSASATEPSFPTSRFRPLAVSSRRSSSTGSTGPAASGLSARRSRRPSSMAASTAPSCSSTRRPTTPT